MVLSYQVVMGNRPLNWCLVFLLITFIFNLVFTFWFRWNKWHVVYRPFLSPNQQCEWTEGKSIISI